MISHLNWGRESSIYFQFMLKQDYKDTFSTYMKAMRCHQRGKSPTKDLLFREIEDADHDWSGLILRYLIENEKKTDEAVGHEPKQFLFQMFSQSHFQSPLWSWRLRTKSLDQREKIGVSANIIMNGTQSTSVSQRTIEFAIPCIHPILTALKNDSPLTRYPTTTTATNYLQPVLVVTTVSYFATFLTWMTDGPTWNLLRAYNHQKLPE